jgi:hypothetical protein
MLQTQHVDHRVPADEYTAELEIYGTNSLALKVLSIEIERRDRANASYVKTSLY